MGCDVGNEAECHRRAARVMTVGHIGKRHFRERVAVDEEERSPPHDFKRVASASGAAEQDRLFPRVADTRVDLAAVADDPRHRLRQIMEVHHDVTDVRGRASGQAVRRLTGRRW